MDEAIRLKPQPEGGRQETAALRDLCASTAQARRGISRRDATGPGGLDARLRALAKALDAADLEFVDRAALLTLLDEVGGLVGQLELEREAVRARILALDRHRRAQVCYAPVRAGQ